jgi:DNA primase
MVVSEAKYLYHCFGTAGSFIDWVMKTQFVSLPHAVQLLKADAQFNPQAELRQVVDYYAATLKQTPEALA